MSLSQRSSHPSYANDSDDYALNDTLSTCLFEKTCKNAGVKKKHKVLVPKVLQNMLNCRYFYTAFQLIPDETTS
jgi:hypothetical protein